MIGTDSPPAPLMRASLPAAQGSPVVVQGRYGSRGNLELVFCDADDGLWVCWFNTDETDSGEPGALPGEWSGGLHFAAGRRYDDVALIQAARGPDFLELVAISGTRLEHWTWTPDDGFGRRGVLPETATGSPALVETDTGLAVAARADSTVRRWSADASDYPDLRWRSEAGPEVPPGASAVAMQVTRDGGVDTVAAVEGQLLRMPPSPGRPWDRVVDLDRDVRDLAMTRDGRGSPVVLVATPRELLAYHEGALVPLAAIGCRALAAAPSVTDRERLEVIGRTDNGLVHVRAVYAGADRIEVESVRTVVSVVRWPVGRPIHRR